MDGFIDLRQHVCYLDRILDQVLLLLFDLVVFDLPKFAETLQVETAKFVPEPDIDILDHKELFVVNALIDSEGSVETIEETDGLGALVEVHEFLAGCLVRCVFLCLSRREGTSARMLFIKIITS